ncbi:hypothetical protein DFJ77DRAFT_512999 [Powellomyces hirtus]|nr:hypothetical protein DFJ77DRAFT_512999 [Powellomyces hirtus]
MRLVRPTTPTLHTLIPQKTKRLGLRTYLLVGVVSAFTGAYVFEPYLQQYWGDPANAANAGGMVPPPANASNLEKRFDGGPSLAALKGYLSRTYHSSLPTKNPLFAPASFGSIIHISESWANRSTFPHHYQPCT